MSSGTKILLAICALLIGGLMLYYSVLGDGTLNPRVVANGPVPSADPLNAPAPVDEATTDRFNAPPLGRPEVVVATDDGSAFDPLQSVDPLGSDGPGLLSGAVARSTTSEARERAPKARVSPGGDPAHRDPGRRTSGQRRLPVATAVTTLSVHDESTRPAVTPPAAREHTVRPGETLSAIAAALLGDARRWREIARANPKVNPHRLQVGQRLSIPAVDRAARPDPVSAPPPAADGETYIVRPGDTLSSIAARTLGDPNRWGEIHDANRRAIGGNENRLKVGMRLVIRKGGEGPRD